MTTTADSDHVYRVALRRALAADDPTNLQVHFEIAVLDRYLAAPGYSLIRTDTVGRLKKERAWAIDFGLTPDETHIHAAWAELQHLPDDDRDHWAAHAALLPASRSYLQMRLSPSACHDDGEVRPWR